MSSKFIFTPSSIQKGIHEYSLVNPDNDLSIIAPSGTGKTTTIKYLMNETAYLKSLYLVFSADMKKETNNSIKNSFTSFPNIANNDNIEVSTLHGKMRATLSELFPDMRYDYSNGLLSLGHLNSMLDTFNIQIDSIEDKSIYLEKFNKVLSKFSKNTQSIRQFIDSNKNELEEMSSELQGNNTSQEISAYIKGIQTSDVVLGDREVENYEFLLNNIFEKGILNTLEQGLPHDIYYKYAFIQHENFDIFKKWDRIYVDEAQDLDPIINHFLRKTDATVMLFGDTDQQVFDFRGSINMLSNTDNHYKEFALNRSYRLPPSTGIIAQSLLNYYNDYKDTTTATIYGFNTKRKFNEFAQIEEEEYIQKIIENIQKIDIDSDELIVSALQDKEKFEQSINTGKKTFVKNAFILHNKTKDDALLYSSILNNTNYFDNRDKEPSLEEKKDIVFNIKRFFLFSVTEKIKREIVHENGTNAYLSRNNKNAINFLRKLVAEIPKEKLSSIPLFNINFSFSKEDKINTLDKHELNTDKLTISQREYFSNALKSLENKDGESFYFLYEKLKDIQLPQKLQGLFKNYENDLDSIEKLLEVKFINIADNSYALEDFGISKNYMAKLFKELKSKNTKLKEYSFDSFTEHLKVIKDIIPLGKMINHLCTAQSIAENRNPFLSQLSNLSKIKEIVIDNENISLTDKNANIHITTVHSSKGQEYDTVYQSGDSLILKQDEEDKIMSEVRLAYVQITRSKGDIYFPKESSLYKIIQEACAKGLERYYGNKSLTVQESLCPDMSVNLKYNFISENNEEKEILQNYRQGSLITFKDIKLTVNEENNVTSIMTNNEYIYGDSSSVSNTPSYIKESTLEETQRLQQRASEYAIEINNEARMVF